MEINICGDLHVDSDSSETRYLSKEVKQLFQNSDLNVVNFESPITKIDSGGKILKSGPHLRSSFSVIEIIKDLNPLLLTLANNHIMDFGVIGLMDTIRFCNDNSLNYVGAGKNLEDAKKPFIHHKYGKIITFLNFCENEWSIADKNEPGANPLDIIENARQIKIAKATSDCVIVITHGGHEFYHMPSPRMVKQYRYYAENGASIVINHHSHCISGYESYYGVPIFYGLGNFLFTMKSKHDSWYTGLILKINIDKNSQIKCNLIPIEQKKETYIVTRLEESQAANVLSEVNRYSLIISDETLLKESWNDFVNENSEWTLNIFNPLNFIRFNLVKRLIRKIKLYRLFYRTENYKEILNYIRCESLNELAKSSIKKLLANKQ